MADFLSSASTVLHRGAFDGMRMVIGEWDGTTAAAVDTVFVPGMTRVIAAYVNADIPLSTLFVATNLWSVALPTSATTAQNQFVCAHTTIDQTTAIRWRYTAFGR